ncbi:MAG: MFS transporter [Dehalococcoidia bacterium]
MEPTESPAQSRGDAAPPTEQLTPVPEGPADGARAGALRPGSGGGLFHRTFESLENRHYLFLWLGMLTAMSGTQMQFYARGVLTYDLTDSRVLTGIVAMGFAPAMLVFALVGGAISDRVERRILIQGVQLGQVVLALTIGTLILTDQIHWVHILIAGMVQGSLFAFMMPARQVIIPRMVGPERLSNAMALNAAAISFTTLVAPAIGGILYGLTGPEGVYFLVAGLNLIAILFTGMIPRFPADPDAARKPMVSDIVEGFRYVGANRVLLTLVLFSAGVSLLSIPLRMQLPVFAKDVYGADPAGVGWLTAAIGAGSLIGALGIASLRRGQRRGFVLLVSAFVSAFGLLLVAGLPWYWAGMLSMVPIGLGEAARMALGMALAMEVTEDQYRGRVSSVFMMTFGLMPLGILPLAFAMDAFGPEVAVLGMGAMLAVFSVLAFAFMRRLRTLQ